MQLIWCATTDLVAITSHVRGGIQPVVSARFLFGGIRLAARWGLLARWTFTAQTIWRRRCHKGGMNLFIARAKSTSAHAVFLHIATASPHEIGYFSDMLYQNIAGCSLCCSGITGVILFHFVILYRKPTCHVLMTQWVQNRKCRLLECSANCDIWW